MIDVNQGLEVPDPSMSQWRHLVALLVVDLLALRTSDDVQDSTQNRLNLQAFFEPHSNVLKPRSSEI